MYIDIVGVFDDGSNRIATLPDNHRTIQVPVGADVTVRLSVIRNDGTPFNLAGSALVFSVKKSTLYAVSQISKTGTLLTPYSNGLATFALVPNDTRNLEPGRYLYDVWCAIGGLRSPLVATSAFLLEPVVTLP